MDSFMQKIGIFLVGIVLAKFIPSGFTYLIVFIFGSVLTISIEIFLFFYYVYRVAERTTPVSRDFKIINRENITQAHFSSHKKVSLSRFPLERRFTVIQCPCNGEKLRILLTGSSKTYIELIGPVKDLLASEKKYANGLIKLGEIGLIEKIKSKKAIASLKPFRDFCFETGKRLLRSGESFTESFTKKLSAMDKEKKKILNELKLNFQFAGEKFEAYGADAKKVNEKLLAVQGTFKKANEEFIESRKDLAQFETLVKKEMRLKKINIDMQSLKAQLNKITESMHEESKKFLPKANEVLSSLNTFERQVGVHYRSMFEYLFSYLKEGIDVTTKSIERVVIPEESKSIKQPIRKTLTFLNSPRSAEGTSNLNRIRRFFSGLTSTEEEAYINKKTLKLEDYANDIIKFLKILLITEQELQKDSLRVYSNWEVSENIYIQDFLSDIKSSLINHYTSETNVFSIIESNIKSFNEFTTRLTQFKSSIDLSNLQSIEQSLTSLSLDLKKTLEDCKFQVFQSLKSFYQSQQSLFVSVLDILLVPDDYDAAPAFNPSAKHHQQQCPCYLLNTVDDDDDDLIESEPSQIGDPQSAFWLNDLLRTFISEWKNSPKFISYLCMRLKKIYNKDNPDYIGEIEVKGVEIGEEAPEIKDFIQLSTENDLEFYYEFDFWYRGDVKMHLEFELKWSVATVNVNVKVVLRSFYGKSDCFSRRLMRNAAGFLSSMSR